MPSLRSTLCVGFGLAMVILVANAVVTYRNIKTLFANHPNELNSRDVLRELEHTRFSLNDAQASYRSYVNSGNDVYLNPFHRAVTNIDRGLDRITALTAENPFQQERIPRLKQCAQATR